MRKIRELMEELTLEEKVSLCQGASFWDTREIEEKGIPRITMSDGPHGLRRQTGETDHLGVNKSVPATCFPSAASIACSWDEELIRQIGEALGEECQKEQVSVLLGPGANIKRSPLCGRNFEYFSEDPYLSSHMAKGHILGVQSKGVGASLKHFALNNQETMRMTVNVKADERTMREIYLASFETAVKEAKPWTIMAAYNRVNGEFCCENHHLLREILRDEWGYEGVVVSDWHAANDQPKGTEEGFDLRMPFDGEKYTDEMQKAVREGRLSMECLDASVARILTLVEKGTEGRVKDSDCDMEAHHRLAVRAAEESMVLLKNRDGALPLRTGEKIAVIGGFAKMLRYQGGGSSHVAPTVYPDFFEALGHVCPEDSFSFARGYRLKRDEVDEAYVAETLEKAGQADKILLFLGLPDTWESEGFDRKHLRIPDNQTDLLERLSATKKPMIVVLFSGAPVETPWIDRVDGVLAAYTAGQGAAEALARLLYGQANPCGKLAETWPMELAHTPCSLTYPQKEEAVYEEGIFVGYRYYEKKHLPVRFPFGYGLSYTTWAYDHLQVDRERIKDTDEIRVSVEVTNTGNTAGKEIVQLYIRDVEASVPRPVKELKGMAKVFCLPGETKQVSFVLDKRSFAYYHTGIRDWYVETGAYEILIGASSSDIRLKRSVYVESTVEVRKKYDAFITMGELMALPVGASLMQTMFGGNMQQQEDSGEEDMEETAMDYGAMGMDMPLVKVADMMQGAITDEMIARILQAVNGDGSSDNMDKQEE